MKSRLFILQAVVGLAVGALTATAAPEATQWQAPEARQGSVRLSDERGGILAVHYTLLPDQPMLYGNRTRFMNEVDLFLKQPMPLAPATERLAFETKGLIPDGKDVPRAVVLCPIVRDANGELFYFMPRDKANLRPSAAGWGAYSTAGFFAGEAGAAAQDLYTTGGKPDNSRPDGRPELLGFRLRVLRAVDAAAAGRGSAPEKPIEGTLYLGAIREEPFAMTFAYPFAYADAFLKAKGHYTFAAQITDAFQGAPIREFRQPLDFDPADPASARQRLEFPLGPDGHYWINYQVTAADGATVTGGFMKHQVVGNPDRTPPRPVALTNAPAIGYLRINPGDPRCGVYTGSAPLEVQVRLFPQGRRDFELQYVLHPYFCGDVLASGKRQIQAADDAARDMTLSFDAAATFRAFRLDLTLLSGGARIDERTYILGRETDTAEQHPRAGMLTDRRAVKQAPYNRFTYTLEDGYDVRKHTRQELADRFRAYVANTHPVTLHHTYMIDLNDFEVLPGVFDFSVLDDVMDAAADYGCKVTVRLAHADQHNGPYRWGKYSRQMSAEGGVIGMLSYGAYAVTDTELVSLWTRAYRALYDRYRAHTAFEGYYIMLPGGEWTVVDQPWAGTVAGYSPVERQGFRDYLQQTLKLSLADVNARWGTAYPSFDAVEPPLPTFRDGAQPDLRVQWLDFCRFKAGLNANFWIPAAVESIRAYDTNRVTIVYGTPSSFSHLYGKLDYGHNGGNHRLDHLGEYEPAWLEGGIGWITEPIHPLAWAAPNDPGRDGWVLDVSVWTMLSQAGGGGANLHVYYYPRPSARLLDHWGGFYALDRFARFAPILQELQPARLVRQTAEVAVHQDKETLFAKHRTTFAARLDDLRRWFSLLEDDGVPSAELTAFPGRTFKLLVPNLLDEVMAKDTFELYVKAVREQGSRLIMSANTGKYVPELGREPFQLLKAFGIPAPQQAYVTRGHASARMVQDHPLFAKGTNIAFQTVTTLREQINSPEVIAHFWQYPYRWIPETDYFGTYPGHQPGGTVLATFEDGGAALSLHRVGKGEVLVFWGTPDISGRKLAGLMKRAAAWAGVVNPLAEAEIPFFTEMANAQAGRHYGLFYNEGRFGKFRVKFPNCPEGDFFCDEMVADQKIGRCPGARLREKGLTLEWRKGDSPLKIVRAIPAGKVPRTWVDSYPVGD